MHELRERCLGYVGFNDLGGKWIMCFTQMQEIFLKLKDFYGFLRSLHFKLVSLELFIPYAATDQCCMCKTIKHYWMRDYVQLQLLPTM